MLPTIDLPLNQSLLLPQLSLPFSELQPKDAKRRVHVPILLYRSTPMQTVRTMESANDGIPPCHIAHERKEHGMCLLYELPRQSSSYSTV